MAIEFNGAYFYDVDTGNAVGIDEIDEIDEILNELRDISNLESQLGDAIARAEKAERIARELGDAIEKLASTPQTFCPGEHRCICGGVMEWANQTLSSVKGYSYDYARAKMEELND